MSGTTMITAMTMMRLSCDIPIMLYDEHGMPAHKSLTTYYTAFCTQ